MVTPSMSSELSWQRSWLLMSPLFLGCSLTTSYILPTTSVGEAKPSVRSPRCPCPYSRTRHKVNSPKLNFRFTEFSKVRRIYVWRAEELPETRPPDARSCTYRSIFCPKAPLLCPKLAGPARWGVRGLQRGCRRLGGSLHSCSLRGSRPAPRLGEPPHGWLLDLAPNGWRGGGDLVVRCVPEWGVSTGCVRRNVHPGKRAASGSMGT